MKALKEKTNKKTSLIVLKDSQEGSSLNRIYNILGGQKVLHKKIENRLDLFELGRKGITKIAFENLANYLNYSTSEMANLLPINARTIQRYKKNQHFSSEVSDHILQIAEVMARGTEVFIEKEIFLNWLDHPCISFGNKKPVSLLQSKFGVDLILDELGRIEHGIYS